MSIGAMWLYTHLSHLRGCVVFASVLAVVTGIAMHRLKCLLVAIVQKRAWWPRARPLQKAMMIKFGFTEQNCTDDTTLEFYVVVILFTLHHFICGIMMLPVVFYGWEGVSMTGRLLFIVAGLADVALDMYDWVKTFCLTFFPHKFRSWGVETPLTIFILIACFHHTLAMGMMIPMLLHYSSLQSFHMICVSLLLAAGISYLAGAYKFTLDTETSAGLQQYKVIVVLQLVIIWFTRGLVWFSQLYLTLAFFWDTAATEFFIGGCIAGTLMSLFNVLMLMESLDAAKKWLPKKLPCEPCVQRDNDLQPKATKRSASCVGQKSARRLAWRLVSWNRDDGLCSSVPAEYTTNLRRQGQVR